MIEIRPNSSLDQPVIDPSKHIPQVLSLSILPSNIIPGVQWVRQVQLHSHLNALVACFLL